MKGNQHCIFLVGALIGTILQEWTGKKESGTGGNKKTSPHWAIGLMGRCFASTLGDLNQACYSVDQLRHRVRSFLDNSLVVESVSA